MSTAWREQTERSNRFAIGFLMGVCRFLGRKPARALLYPITVYFLLFAPKVRRASRGYLSRVFGRPAQLKEVFRHVFCFAETALDRVFLLTQGTTAFQIDRSNRSAETLAIVEGDSGVLLLLAHVGSFEVLRVARKHKKPRPLYILMDREHTGNVNAMLERANPEMAAHVIDASSPGPILALKMREVLNQGGIVALMCDRIRNSENHIAVPFFGSTAYFPLAPWQLAALMQVPVLLGFGLYLGNASYDSQLTVMPMAKVARDERRAAIEASVHQYVALLEQHLRQYPYNWFNFYDFWQAPAASTR